MTSRPDHKHFIFDSLGANRPKTARKSHIRLLYDVLQLSLQRADYPRARRAWSVLVRCKEVDWKALWNAGVMLVDDESNEAWHGNSTKLEYLSAMMLQYPEERQAIFQELILRYIFCGQHARALDELELYLPSQPYEGNPVLYVYAGLICIYLAQPNHGSPSSWNMLKLRDAQLYLEKAKSLDSENLVASAWLQQLPSLSNQYADTNRSTPESDTEDVPQGQQQLNPPRTKRAKNIT